MNFKITLASILTVLLLSSCLDCMDCQSTTDINLSIEYYSMDSGTMNLDSTNNLASVDLVISMAILIYLTQ